jgi:hypothetical protein
MEESMATTKTEDREVSIDKFSTDELEQATGGLNPQPLPPGILKGLSIGSQSSGAGAGKITFNPF